MNDPFARASRLGAIEVSEILEIGARAARMNAEGDDVITLGAGEPDFPTPEPIRAAAKAAIDRGETGYTALDGTPALKQAVRDKFLRDNGLDYALEEITVGAGAKQILFIALMATVEPGDEVIVPTPYWTSYADIVRIAGGVPVFVPCPMETGFRLTARALEAALTPRTRWIILNSPSNPSGAAYAREDYRPILDVLLGAPQVGLLVDDMYEHIVYDDFDFVTPAQVEPRLRERTLTVNGVSKAYAMTGWRVGFAAGPAKLIAEMTQLQGQSTSHTAAVSQKAAQAALEGGLDEVHKMASAFAERAQQVADGLAKIDAIDCHPAQGSFYCLPNFERVIASLDGVEDDQQLGDWLLQELGIAMVPGSAFNAPGHMRLSFAADSNTLDEGLERLQQAFA